MSTWKPNCGSSTPRSPRERPWDAAATPCTNPASFGSGIFFRTGANGRAGELGIFEGFVGTVLEPDIASHNRITGDDIAFAWSRHRQPPNRARRRSKPLRSLPSSRRRISKLSSLYSTTRCKPGKCGPTKTVPAHVGLSVIVVNARDRINRADGSDIAAFDLFAQALDQLRHLFKVRVDRERLAEGIERALFVAEILHDHAKPRQRAEMARLADQYLLDILERMGVIVLQIIQRRAPVPSLDIVGTQLDHGVEQLQRDVHLLRIHCRLGAHHQ